MAIFTWYPDAGHSREMEPRAMGSRFGDGYEQRTADGINTQLGVWVLTFTGGRAEADAIDSFLKARGGVEHFTWTNPDEETGLYLCRKWTKRRERSVKTTISCQFEQVAA